MHSPNAQRADRCAYSIGLDTGSTKIAAGVVGRGGNSNTTSVASSSDEGESGTQALAVQVIERLRQEYPVTWAIGGELREWSTGLSRQARAPDPPRLERQNLNRTNTQSCRSRKQPHLPR
jgi:hypothetical protein